MGTFRGMTETHNIGEPATLPLSELSTYHRNPRVGNVKAIKQSMTTNGVYKPIVVNKGSKTGRVNEVLAGNHSLKAMRELAAEFPNDERWKQASVWLVDVDEEHAKKIVLADNRTADLGSYDEETLAELLGEVKDSTGTGYTDDDLDSLLNPVDGTQADVEALREKYTNLVKVPHYTPDTEYAPLVEECYDTTKTEELETRIKEVDMPEATRQFLLAAAQRHTVLDFQTIADFYAHQRPEVQRLMEEQALVIIDFGDAIANGYTVLSKALEDVAAADKLEKGKK